MIFSLLSLITTVLSSLSQQKIANSRDFVSIEFDVTGSSVVLNKNKCRNRVKFIKSAIASLLGLEETLLEILRPTTIKKGLKLIIHIYINNAKAVAMSIEKDMNEAQRKGEIQEIIKTAWKFDGVPTVSKVKYMMHESTERRENTVFIGMIKRISKKKIDLVPNTSERDAETEIAMSIYDNTNGRQMTGAMGYKVEGVHIDHEKERNEEAIAAIPDIDVSAFQANGKNEYTSESEQDVDMSSKL